MTTTKPPFKHLGGQMPSSQSTRMKQTRSRRFLVGKWQVGGVEINKGRPLGLTGEALVLALAYYESKTDFRGR
ncbi:hypothetical protein V6N12_027286 [Hibiscus sabdariffa]|uniref:Uncharacterized protein n=1 Tax=Hibiscus sabdariffa TaxID=183260 RepID=A0ABR2DU99_9ROSI